jgi:hypothetical protein
MTEETILQAVMNEKLFGALEVDLHVPDDLKSKFAEMPVNDVFIGDCFPIAGISIKLAGLGHYLLLWISISRTSSITDVFSEFLEAGRVCGSSGLPVLQ